MRAHRFYDKGVQLTGLKTATRKECALEQERYVAQDPRNGRLQLGKAHRNKNYFLFGEAMGEASRKARGLPCTVNTVVTVCKTEPLRGELMRSTAEGAGVTRHCSGNGCYTAPNGMLLQSEVLKSGQPSFGR